MALLLAPGWRSARAARNERSQCIGKGGLPFDWPAEYMAMKERCGERIAGSHCVYNTCGKSLKELKHILFVDRAATAAERDANYFYVVS